VHPRWVKTIKRPRDWYRGRELYLFTCNSLSTHAAENRHEVLWEEVPILGSENNAKKRKFHEAAVMDIGNNDMPTQLGHPSIVALYVNGLKKGNYKREKAKKPSAQQRNNSC
jgi:hypothetical protein